MHDSGSLVSILRLDSISAKSNIHQLLRMQSFHLITARGSSLHIKDYVQAPVQIGDAKVIQQFLYVQNLISPIILELDFMKKHKHKVTLDYTTSLVSLHFNGINCTQQQSFQVLTTCGVFDVLKKGKCFQLFVVNMVCATIPLVMKT